MKDLIIIGGGPAGMTAAIYAARQKLDFFLLTREFGGQMAKKEVAIENYPGFSSISAQELIAKFRDHLNDLGAEVKFGEADALRQTEVGFSLVSGEANFEARAVIIATGSSPVLLNIPGEKEFIGRGVGYCVTCDGPLFSRRDVAVIGTGNYAYEAAIFLAKFAKKIFIIERGAQLSLDEKTREAAEKTGKIEVIGNAKIKQIKGDNFVKEIIYEGTDGKEFCLPIEGVFIKFGNQPASMFARQLVELNERNEIKVDCQTLETKTHGLFAAGDVTDVKYKQIVIAAGEGAKAAMAANQYLINIKKNQNK